MEGFVQLAQSAPNNAIERSTSPASDSVMVGLLGQNIQLSRTPKMHENEGARLGLQYIYKLFDTQNSKTMTTGIEEILSSAQTCGFAGLNITYPYKQEIIPLIDVLDEDAKQIGAINTVVFRNGKTFGHNTDLWGFAEGFRRKMNDVSLDRVLQIGAGGAGSAVANALTQLGVKHLFVTDINFDKAIELASRLQNAGTATKITPILQQDLDTENYDGLVNTSPVGMERLPGIPVDQRILSAQMWVADIIYFPLETKLLRTARTLGCRTLSGAPMAVFQAVKSFELFTGLSPDSACMKATFDTFDQQQTETAKQSSI